MSKVQNDLDPDAKIIYRWKNPHPRRERMLANEAEEYIVEDAPQANSGIVVYGKYGEEIIANPWSTRPLVKELIRQLAECQEIMSKPNK